MNMHTKPVISGAAPLCLFAVGDFVRIRGTEEVGRVIDVAENEDYPIPFEICVFGATNRNEQFASFHLEMWTPRLPTSATPLANALDIEELQTKTLKILGAFELIGTLVTTAIEKDARRNHEHEAFLSNVELVAETFADLTSGMLDVLHRA